MSAQDDPNQVGPASSGGATAPADEMPMPSWRQAGHRYHRYSHFVRERFGKRMMRVSVDGGFTCPNVDGTVTTGGCVFCDNRSFSPARRLPRTPIARQIDQGIDLLDRRLAPEGYLAYFQAATNTYASLDKLQRLYDEAADHPRIEGLIIGTRPDCAPDAVLDLIESFAERMFVAVEYGLQTIHQRSLDWMNRGHDADCFFDAVQRTRGRGIDISTHVILGLPGESRDEIFATIDAVAGAGIDGVKIHSLHVVRGTPMEQQFHRGEIPILQRDEYAELAIDVLERLPADMVIHRLTGDAPGEFLIAPQWPRRKAEFLQHLERRMQARDSVQGLRKAP